MMMGMMRSRGGQEDDDSEEEEVQGGESVGDFFHYNLKNVPLKFNHPLSIPFIDECNNIGYEDIYHIDLEKVSKSSGTGEVEVKHAITFKNTSGQPLTTAPVSILAKTEDNNSKFMVQGMMKYTSPAKNATIEITRTMEVDGKFVVETNKERKTEVINEATTFERTGLQSGTCKKQYVDSIEKSAKVVIKNAKDVEIKCKIEHQLFGHLEESTPDFKEKTEHQSNHQGLNPTTKYAWEITVPASGKAELNFKYCVKEWNHALNKSDK
jgi:hypothetical protein